MPHPSLPPEIMAQIVALTGPAFTPQVQAQCDAFYDTLIETNQSLNLTRITEYEDVWVKHFMDSWTAVPHLPTGQPFALLDLGTGAGIPAIPLAILFPQAQVTAVDSVQKKIRFVQEASQKLELTNCTALAVRVETLGQDKQYRGQFDVVTARAVTGLNVLLEYAIPLLKVNGLFIAYKTETAAAEECQAAQSALKTLGATVVSTLAVQVPHLPNRTLVVVQKTRATDKQYPRLTALISKKPL